MGAKNNKADELARLERRKKVAEMYLQGQPQWVIGQQLGVDAGTICEDLKIVRREWRESAVQDFDAAKEQELAKIDLLESTSWNAWVRSCEPAETRIIRTEKAPRIKKKPLNGKNGRVEIEGPLDAEVTPLEVIKKHVERTIRGQTGNQAHLATVKWCIEMRLKIKGILEEKGGDVNVYQINWEEMMIRDPVDGRPDPIEAKIMAVKALAAHQKANPPPAKGKKTIQVEVTPPSGD